MAKLIHSMLGVLDLDRSISFYEDVLGMSVSRKLEFPDFTLVYLRGDEADFEIELTHNHGRDTPYAARSTHKNDYLSPAPGVQGGVVAIGGRQAPPAAPKTPAAPKQ